MHLAEFNFGTLRYAWGDPRISGFEDALDRVNSIAARSAGFVWRLPDEDMDAAQNDSNGPLADRPNTASTLSVWTDAASLYHFVTKTLHARIMARHAEWFVPGDSGFLVCWWIEEGHRPTVDEAMRLWLKLQEEGPTSSVFAGAGLKSAAFAQTKLK